MQKIQYITPQIYDFEEVIHYFIMDSFEETDLINEGVS